MMLMGIRRQRRQITWARSETGITGLFLATPFRIILAHFSAEMPSFLIVSQPGSCLRCYDESLLLDWEIRIATMAAMFTTRYI